MLSRFSNALKIIALLFHFISYIADLASKSGIRLHAFADDNQLHVHCDLSDVLSSVIRLEQCATAIGHWMSANWLKLNAEKTELLWAGTRHSVTSLLRSHDPTLILGTDAVKATDTVSYTHLTLPTNREV